MSRRLSLEEGWFTLLLVWSLVITVAAAILNAELIDGLEVLPFVGTVAIFTGLLLAKSRFSSRQAHFTALVYGVFLVTALMAHSLPGELSWRERVIDLFQRQFVWLEKALSQGSSRDGLIFVIHTSAVFWLLGYTAAWYTFRNLRLWRVVLPSGLVLLSVIYYYYGPKPLAAFMALYTLIALVYIARTHLVFQERIWRTTAVRYEKDIRFGFMQASFLAAVVALGIAWGLPAAQASTTVSDALGETGLSNTWREVQDNWSRLFASLRSYGTGTEDVYGSNLSLGGPRSVVNSLVMDVYVAERIPFVYWQAVVYDHYQDGRWAMTADTERLLHLPDEGQLESVPYRMRREVLQNFVNFVPNSGTIHAAPEPILSDRQVYVTYSEDENGNKAVQQLSSRFVMRQGESYQVISSYSMADADSLRLAPSVYSDYITRYYLQVPSTLSPETLALAAALTAPHDNAFDKAISVRNYLRENVTYNDQISAPPDGVEPIHYVLFENPEGYCTYYASAMVMMLRSQGVPARFVGGYAQGEWDEATRSYRVRASNSHTWVEVYFPGYGWIQFEPTAALPVGDRPESFGNPGDAFGNDMPLDDLDFMTLPEQSGQLLTPTDIERGAEGLTEEQDDMEPEDGRLSLWRAVAGVGVVGAAAFVVLVGGRLNRRVEGDVERSYDRLARWAHWLGILIKPAHTPYERANLLAAAVPEGREPLRKMTHQYVLQRFSRHRAGDADYDILEEWRFLRPKMIRSTILHQLSRWRRESDASERPSGLR
jgi:transglutaminase-like putative cysteine protease